MLGTPIAHEAAASLDLDVVATSATRPTLENLLHDLDAAVAGLDRLIDAAGEHLHPILLPVEPSPSTCNVVDASGDSVVAAWVGDTTRRIEDLTAGLASIIERVQL